MPRVSDDERSVSNDLNDPEWPWGTTWRIKLAGKGKGEVVDRETGELVATLTHWTQGRTSDYRWGAHWADGSLAVSSPNAGRQRWETLLTLWEYHERRTATDG